MNAPTTICSLVCHSHVPMARRCFASLTRFHRAPFRLRLHDDGTLTHEDRDHLRATAPEVTFISRQEADDIILPRLARHPRAYEYRRTLTMALKLVDIALIEPGPMHYCDSDILFLRPFEGFGGCLETARPPVVLMRDDFNTYSGGWRRLLVADRLPLADRINAGLILLGENLLDLDYVEWFLSRPEAQDTPHFADQTFWAALVQKEGGYAIDRRTLCFPPATGVRGLPAPAARPVAWHFVSPLRARFDEVAAAVDVDTTADALPPLPIAIHHPPALNFGRYCVSRWQKGRLAKELAREEAALP